MTVRSLTLPLTVFGTILFTATMLIIQGAIYIANLPDSRAGLNWTILLIMVPTVVTGIVSGLTAALGAYIGRRMSSRTADAPTGRKKSIAGAGLGGALGSTVFLIYLSLLYQNGPGPWILVLGFIVVFGVYAGFTALWTGRKTLASPAEPGPAVRGSARD
ncbi:hypothetical protein [Microbacterium sp. LWH13-1.2]|uniref:hypothetical protein n=1 Tax=Microbacterium sp. LWH13-1.2 TaxID=3135260 RepID=UPI003138CB9B